MIVTMMCQPPERYSYNIASREDVSPPEIFIVARMPANEPALNPWEDT